MTLNQILSPIQDDLLDVNQLIRERLASDIVLINQLGEHIVASGGKRLRPALVLLAARAGGYAGRNHVQLAAVIEFIHTATLLHDDVVDHSELRRGEATANALWGNEASVLTGDFLYSRAFQLMVELGSLPILEVLAHTTNVIAEGEVLQLMNCHNPDISEAVYDDVIRRKTAILFEAAARTGALLAGAPEDEVEALSQYGHHLGMAFQLIDDCLDYRADAATTGKNLGDDLADGKVTLPLIIALERVDQAERAALARIIREGDTSQLEKVTAMIEASDAITYTAGRAELAAQAAVQSIEGLGEHPVKQTLVQLAEFAADRVY